MFNSTTCMDCPRPMLVVLEPIDDVDLDAFVRRFDHTDDHMLGFAAFYLPEVGAAEYHYCHYLLSHYVH